MATTTDTTVIDNLMTAAMSFDLLLGYSGADHEAIRALAPTYKVDQATGILYSVNELA